MHSILNGDRAISSSSPIGVFDSGVGGLTVLAELRKLEKEIEEAPAKRRHGSGEVPLRAARREMGDESGERRVLVEPDDDALATHLAEHIVLQRLADRADLSHVTTPRPRRRSVQRVGRNQNQRNQRINVAPLYRRALVW